MTAATDSLTASRRITAEVTSWPGVTAGPGRRGELAFTVGRRPLRHLHGDRAAHFSFPKAVWAQLRAEGRITEHPVSPGKEGPAARRHRDRCRRRGRHRAAAAQLRPRDRVSPVRTIEVIRFGGPEVLELRERPDPVAGPGQ